MQHQNKNLVYILVSGAWRFFYNSLLILRYNENICMTLFNYISNKETYVILKNNSIVF